MVGKQLMHQACSLPEMDKDALICRLFGYIEIIESQDETVSADDLYNEIKSSVDFLKGVK